MVIHSNEKYPLFVDPTKKGDHFPTVFAVQAYPQLIGKLHLFPKVQEFVFKGANLMWPGVDKKDEIEEFE
jgi:predicted ribosome-associated RNA-binding protein Tma20